MTTEEENIYNLIPREYLPQSKASRYNSKFRTNVKHEYKSSKAPAKTMGPAKVLTRPPDQFLKKHELEPKLPDRTEFHYQDNKKPPVPKVGDRPVMGLKTTKNFVTQNAVDTIMSVSKKAEPIYVDTNMGDKRPLIPSGLEPIHIKKKEYGRTPHYIEQRKKEIKEAQEEYDRYVAEHFKRGALRKLTEDERDEIIDGLKTNWERVHKEYQGLSVVTDTMPKKYRKERMEMEMKQLERDIETMERHQVIYIANN